MQDAQKEMNRKQTVAAGYVMNTVTVMLLSQESQSPRLWSNYVITTGSDCSET